MRNRLALPTCATHFLLGELMLMRSTRRARQHASARPDRLPWPALSPGNRGSVLGRKLTVIGRPAKGGDCGGGWGVPVVSDFRPADMAVGGKVHHGAVSRLHALSRSSIGRIAQNMEDCKSHSDSSQREIRPSHCLDTGPGNMVIDAVTEKLFGITVRSDGRIAASGRILR